MKKVCNFCGRNEREVKLLISGINGYICEDCARQAYEIVRESGLAGSGKESKQTGTNGGFDGMKGGRPCRSGQRRRPSRRRN